MKEETFASCLKCAKGKERTLQAGFIGKHQEAEGADRRYAKNLYSGFLRKKFTRQELVLWPIR